MSEDAGEKTEAPTPRRLTQAREQGNIARSPDLTAAVVLIAVMMLLKYYGPPLVGTLKSLVQQMLGPDSFKDFGTDSIGETLMRAVLVVGAAMAPLLVGTVIVAILINLVQVGFNLNLNRIQPNIAALNPLKGLGKIFHRGQGLVQLGMSVLKMCVAGLVAYSAVHGKLAQIVSVQQLSFIQIFGLSAQIVYQIVIRIGIFMLVLALIDYIYQRFRIAKELKMSKEEVKEEMRSMDGDPKVKARRKDIARQIAMNRLKKDVPKADVVVTNPTEYAIALKYDGDAMHAPRVVAKGQGPMAKRIREIAIAHGIPILERKPLARALYKVVEVGQEIPEEFYAAVAEILAYVYELSGKLRKKSA